MPSKITRALVTLVLVCVTLNSAVGQETSTDNDDRMGWWRDAKFGLFIHWGLYAVPAGEWKGKTSYAEWIRHRAEIPINEYDKFRNDFNPTKYDPEQWAKLAKAAGVKYLVITSKHHDGFCLWPSEQTDFDVENTAYGKDLLGPLKTACDRQDIKYCFYHSIMDWHHPDYLPRRGWEQAELNAEGADYDRYEKYMKAQLNELVQSYGPLGVMWFDGEWEETWTHERGAELYEYVRSLQPDIVVNNRVDKGRQGMSGFNKQDGECDYAGDFGTPEQEIPATGVPGVDWETCMTMNAHWGWNKNDHKWKSTSELVRKLIDVVSKGGNFLLNIGPKPDGTFPEEAIARLDGIGKWMAVNQEAIYSTTASPFESLPWGRCTQRSDGELTTLYLHVFDWPEEGQLLLPRFGNEVSKVYLLADKTKNLKLSREAMTYVIEVPKQAPDEIASVIAVELVGSPVVYRTPKISADSAIFLNELRVAISVPQGLEVRYTTDGSVPGKDSQLYSGPFTLNQTTTLRAVSVHAGVVVSPKEAKQLLRKVKPLKAVKVVASHPGVQRERFEGEWESLPDFDSLQPVSSREVASLGLPHRSGDDHFALRTRGFIDVAKQGLYQFQLGSDDGSALLVHGKKIVDNDGLHGLAEAVGSIALAPGKHPVEAQYFNRSGGARMTVKWGPVGGPWREIAPKTLSH